MNLEYDFLVSRTKYANIGKTHIFQVQTLQQKCLFYFKKRSYSKTLHSLSQIRLNKLVNNLHLYVWRNMLMHEQKMLDERVPKFLAIGKQRTWKRCKSKLSN